MKHKKWLALFLAAALTVSTAMPTPMTVVASEQENKPVVTESVEEPEQEAETEEAAETEEKAESEEVSTPEEKAEGEEVTAPEEKTEGEEVTVPEEKAEGEEVTEPEEKTEDKEVTEPEEKTEGEEVTASEEKTEGEEVAAPEEKTESEESVPEEKIEGEEVTDSEETAEEVSEDATEETVVVEDEIEGQPAVQSLLPLEEKSAYAVLYNYSEEQQKAIPVSDILNSLRDENGDKIEIPDSKTVVWNYFKDSDGNRLYDEFHALEKDSTVDASPLYDSDYTIQLIVGNGNQLDADAIRYIVRIYITKDIEESITYDLCQVTPDDDMYWYANDVTTEYSAEDNLTIRTTNYEISNHGEGDQYFATIKSAVARRQDMIVDAYTPEEFKKLLAGQNAVSITDKVINQDASEINGFRAQIDATTRICLVYKEKESARIIGWIGLDLKLTQELSYYTFSGSVFTFDGQKMVEIADKKENFGDTRGNQSFEINHDSGNITTGNNGGNYASFYLKDGYTRNTEKYLVLEVKDQNGNDASSHITKIVDIDTDSDVDIKEQLLAADKSKTPYGYKAAYKWGGYFKVYFDNGTTEIVDLYVNESSKKDADPYFNVYGAVQGEKEFSEWNGTVYVVENEWDQTLDSYYKNGYQTLFLNDSDVDLSQLKPLFSTDDETRVYVGTEQKSGESVQDFSKGPVQYTAIVDGKHQKNYQVSFIKKVSGAKLYVNGPSEREVMLNEDNEYQHDILISNIGDAELTGLKVELNATHAKLDDYWTVGGNGNDKLGAFTTTRKTTSEGELPNLAKIRILPDGTGTISGTLTISADGQEPVVIKLKGYASNPYITTEGLAEGVKYVPYSFVVATNNMHDWNDVEFKITSGRLPNGVTLSSVNGEIYGVPTETGEFPIRIEASYSNSKFKPYYADFTLVVKENTNENVYNSSDEGYELKEALGVDVGNHDYVLQNTNDQLFVSTGVLEEFQDLWLNGEKLVDGVDYTKVSGSTRITVRSQTFKNKLQEGTNTIAAEFRVDGDTSKELKRTAQNFRLEIKGGNGGGNKKSSGGGSGSGSGNESTASSGTTAATETTAGAVAFNGVKFVARVMDANNQPMASATVELHSTPQTVLTNVSGYATFNPVEFGTHTFIVKDSAGNVLATKEFELQEGNSVVINGSKLVAKNGSTVALSLKVENGELTFVSAVATGDHEQPMVWMVMLLSCLVILGVVGYRKRNMWFKR